ncbi:hypothetical protein Snoj_25660 [Streptomyces nojiriensis]|uniref:Uncharacterized protein n=1 Tax=Streptomyces nojiriensis TaxID=66374 RepID=A0ABQ3SKH8_9ACTN|nr:hypothetical protein GCM10010205_69260 [Streptomyces nojiriensis]GHI68648.1 hypothetical protein Snoj_25660 [Streptomyces nojiriensis]
MTRPVVRGAFGLDAAESHSGSMLRRRPREYIFSDEGQRDLGDGFARLIRDEHVGHYAAAKRIRDAGAWVATVKKLPQVWQDQVVSAMKQAIAAQGRCSGQVMPFRRRPRGESHHELGALCPGCRPCRWLLALLRQRVREGRRRTHGVGSSLMAARGVWRRTAGRVV